MTQVVRADVARPTASKAGRTTSLLPAIKVWLWVSALATAAGWSLSALGQLTRWGYLAFGLLAVAVFLLGRRAFGWEVPLAGFNWRKLRRRFRRWLPASFAVLTFLVFLGGALYPPSNHAAFTYRTPRVLHWLMEGHWHWIYTPDYRMNDRACGFEWLSAPILLFTKSDRGLFLINFLSFLLLPGLIFSLFTRLGVRRRVAWYWMWLLPTGYNFLLQAGSTANDTFPTVYALAAMDFGLRAWASRRTSDLGLSVLAAALLTGAKASNLTLLLPWAIVVCPLLPLLLRKPLATAGLLAMAATVSFLPTAILNQHYCGDWSGLKLEREGMNMKNPVVGVWGNALLLMKNFVPPFFPLAGKWNQSALTSLPHAVVGPMVANFEQGFHAIGEMPTEDGAGIGFGLSVLIAASVIAGLRRKARGDRGSAGFQPAVSRISNPQGLESWGDMPTGSRRYSRLETCATICRVPSLVRRLALIAPWGSLLAYGMKSGIVDAPRLISPYYALLLPSMIIGAGQAQVVRRRWWRGLVWGVLILAVPVVMTIPGRPLWPAQTVLSELHARKPGQRTIGRALEVYTVYGNRWDSLAQVRAFLPPGLKEIGFLGHGDDVDISLWRPFFSRRVKHILLEDTADQIRERHIEYAVVSGGHLATSGVPLDTWLQRSRAELLGTVTATQTVIHGPQPWYVVRFR